MAKLKVEKRGHVVAIIATVITFVVAMLLMIVAGIGDGSKSTIVIQYKLS
jgi:hypothetical protein